MENKKTAVFGIYASVSQAENAVDRLLQSGFSNSDIHCVLAGDDRF